MDGQELFNETEYDIIQQKYNFKTCGVATGLFLSRFRQNTPTSVSWGVR